ncbi:transcription antitermination factor NusB [Arundinibacter roseus]|uniref:Transcription antitermination protein NusB n=1 Tax=Arundinibacter roseus TaxID=2070510 RepID=A0A4R4KBX4_9BACT|nr:transcription antitermination factor NusB [Arundinibacter roseus]TDB65113.1 transcription antitermination factor NusB [Arundinibacter roseus]
MLNRRLLRTKVVQALYASQIATEADRLLAIDEIAEAYLPDLNSMLPQNREKLEGLKRLSIMTLGELIKKGQPSTDEELPFEVIQTARRAFETYTRQTQRDRQAIVRRVLKETEAIYDEFLSIIMLLMELGFQSKLEREREYPDPDIVFPIESGLDTNAVILLLQASETLEIEFIRRGISWSNDLTIIRKTFREALRSDDVYIDYCKKNVHTPEEDQKMVQHVLRQVILKHEIPLTHLQQNDLYWEDHFELIRGLAIKTLKSADTGKIQLPELTDDWDEDQFFVEELFNKTIEHEAEYESYLHEQLKNWDLERIAQVDMIIMKTALAELIHFPSIPVKVSINEYIEIAKRYSTLKSGKFVNGNLDRLAEKLKEKGIIRKSGRGLIDNK